MGGLLSGLEIVAGAALMVTGVGALAGAMLITEGIASSGLIGGSVGKFLNSGLGKGLMAAVSLGSAAVAMYGATAAQAGAAAAAADTNPVVGAAGQATISTTVGADTDAVATNSSFVSSVNAGQDVSALADPATAAATGTNPASLTAVNTSDAASGGIAPPTTGAAGSQASAAATQGAQNAVTPLATGGQPAAAAGSGAPQGAAASPLASTSATPNAPLVGDTQPGSPLAGGGTAGPDQLGIPQSDIGTQVPPGGGPATTPSSASGMLGKAASFIGKNPGVAVAGGQMLSGIAQGAAQEKTMQEQLAAAQWGNLQWQNPAEVQQLQSAAAAPITVPQGYLQRAQQVRGLMTGATQSPGVQPMQVAGAAPGAPLAPKLPGQA